MGAGDCPHARLDPDPMPMIAWISRPHSRRGGERHPRLATGLLGLVLAAACGDAAEGGEGAAGREPPAQRRVRATAPGAIAYVGADGRELRLIMPDGSGGRRVWSVPDTLYRITAPAWSPDGTEIAFGSDHEMAVSFYQRDLYAIGPDGGGLRRLTNPPAHADFARRPKGAVAVTVQNLTFDGGPYFVYVMGAPEPKQEVLAPANTTRLTFEDVADLGDGVMQPVVVISGINRWWDAAAAVDVRPGRTVQAAPVSIGATPIQNFGADGPFWRADGSRVGFFFGPTCLLQQVPAEPPPGPSFDPLLDPQAFRPACAADWGPVAAADELLVTDAGDYTESGETHVLRVKEGSRERGTPVTTFGRYVRVLDVRWLPDASGFVVARQDDLVDEDVNLYEFTFATGQLRKITDFTGEFVRYFSISPDGRSIAFERVSQGGISEIATLPSDLWIVERDGSGLRLLARGAAYPAWNRQPP